jgi:hypothetical protein
MSAASISISKEKLQTKKLYEPKSLVYLPKEGLQGEDIPSHILWENIKVESVQISFHSPLKFKEVFNAESWEKHKNEVIVKKVELDGYIGLSFESSKVSDLEVIVPVKYLINLLDGNIIEETRQIKLFRPQLKLEVRAKPITITAKTGFVRDRIKIKNIGRGILIMHISTEKNSLTKIETPPEQREFAEKFLSDLIEELSNLAKKFPQFQSVLDDVPKWETRDILELSQEERDEFIEYIKRMAEVLASDRDLLLGFMNAYGKALARNSELIEAVKRVIRLYESLVSKDLLLINPFDEITLTGKKVEIAFKISQTDKIFDVYKDIKLPKIELTSDKEVKIPIYRLFEWG